MKKLLYLALVLSLCLLCVVMQAEEEQEIFTSGAYQYSILVDGTAHIMDYKEGYSGKLTIPSQLDGHIVTSIGDYAFDYCTYLESVTIPDSVKMIGANPFRSCKKLVNIIVSPDHPYLSVINGVLFSKQDKRLICYPCAFTISSYEIPQGIRVIGEESFCNCDYLTSLIIPDSVTEIQDEAFSYCDSITSITIPKSVAEIGINPFIACGKLSSIRVSSDHPYLAVNEGVLFSKIDKRLICYPSTIASSTYTIPNSVRLIGNSAFYACEKLTKVTISLGVTAIGDHAFHGCHNLVSVTIPTSITSIGEWAFAICRSLHNVTIPSSVMEIKDYAFCQCDNFTNMMIPNGVNIIGHHLFYGCDNLVSVELSNSVTSIGEATFNDCSNLKNMIIPNSVTSIGDSAFENCDSLFTLTIPDSVVKIGKHAFSGCKNLTITVNRGSYAEEYCKKLSLKYQLSDYMDWLNN